MYNKIIPFFFLILFLSCSTGKGIRNNSDDYISNFEISLNNIDRMLEDGQSLKAIQYILSAKEIEEEYEKIYSKYPLALSQLEESFFLSLEEKNYKEAIKYYKSFSALGIFDKTGEWTEIDLEFEYCKQLFNANKSTAAIAFIYDNIDYDDLLPEQLLFIEKQYLKAKNRGALQDIYHFYLSKKIEMLPESDNFIREPVSIEKMIDGTVTIWINKGIKIENGVGIPDRSIGSGFFIDNEGYILTNYHVIFTEVDPEYEGFSRMFIKLSDNSEERIPAKVIGWDKEFDIALLKTEIDPSYIFSLSKSYKPVIGEKIYAIGSPGGLKNTTTSGFVSSLSRQIQPIGDSLQIDVPINPGNSGGPLLNSDAEVMGIIFAGIEQFEGVNFAIPVSDVKEFLPAMYQGGEVEHPWLGCGLFERENHLEVLYVIPGTPAEEIGLERGDIIISIDDKKFTKIADTQRYILRNDIGTLLKIKWLRKSGFYSSVVSIDKRPSLPMETALERDIIDNLFVPLFGMEVERIKGNGNKNILYSLKNVYPGSTADEAGLSIGDSIYLLKWIEDKENKIFYIQIIMKNRKAGFLESIVQVGTYLIKGFII